MAEGFRLYTIVKVYYVAKVAQSRPGEEGNLRYILDYSGTSFKGTRVNLYVTPVAETLDEPADIVNPVF